MSLRSGWRVRRRAIAGSSRRTAGRAWRGGGGRLLLIVLLLAVRRLRCHGGHGAVAAVLSCGSRGAAVRWAGYRDGGGGPENAVLEVEWAGAGTRACFSSRGLQMLHAARWQIGSGYGAVRTCMSSNWIGSARGDARKSVVCGGRGVASARD